jgi:hypothetical protein
VAVAFGELPGDASIDWRFWAAPVAAALAGAFRLKKCPPSLAHARRVWHNSSTIRLERIADRCRL